MSDQNESGERASGARRAASEETIEVRRYVDALRRSLPLIVGIVVILAVSTYAISTSLPKRYKATASIVQRVSALGEASTDTNSLVRDLNTIDALLTTDSVLSGAARSVNGESTDSLRDKVSSTVDPNANLIYVTAEDSTPAEGGDDRQRRRGDVRRRTGGHRTAPVPARDRGSPGGARARDRAVGRRAGRP